MASARAKQNAITRIGELSTRLGTPQTFGYRTVPFLFTTNSALSPLISSSNMWGMKSQQEHALETLSLHRGFCIPSYHHWAGSDARHHRIHTKRKNEKKKKTAAVSPACLLVKNHRRDVSPNPRHCCRRSSKVRRQPQRKTGTSHHK